MSSAQENSPDKQAQLETVTVPKVFISYAWESTEIRGWAKSLAKQLRADGVNTILDVWHTSPGDQLPVFMEKAIRESDFVIIVCTPGYKARSDARTGGVGYEGDILTAHVCAGASRRKFIPVLRRGNWTDAAPDWLLGSHYIDLSDGELQGESYAELVNTIFSRRETAPPVVEAHVDQSQDFEQTSGTLDTVGHNLTRMAKEGSLDSVFVRKGFVRSIVRVLNQHRRNHVLLVGSAGVGKTASIVGLTRFLADRDYQQEVYVVSINSQVKTTFCKLLRTLAPEPPLIICLQDLHLSLAKDDGTLNSALEYVIENTEHRIITTTTPEAHAQLKQSQLIEEHFTSVTISEPSDQEAEEIVRTACETLKQHHGVSVTAEAIALAVRLARDHIHEGILPEKALQLIDEACAYSRFPSTTAAGVGGVVDDKVIRYVLAQRLGARPQDLS